MKHVKHEIARALEELSILYEKPKEATKNKTRAGQGNGFQGNADNGSKDTLTSDHVQAPQFMGLNNGEESRRAPIRAFRAAGRALLPFTVWEVAADDFGNTYILTTAQGGELFNHQERQFVLWLQDALERVLRGCV